MCSPVGASRYKSDSPVRVSPAVQSDAVSVVSERCSKPVQEMPSHVEFSHSGTGESRPGSSSNKMHMSH